MLLQDIDIVRRQLEELRSRGVRVAIDDFGTGYSSLSYLSTLPVDAIKIDRSFIRGLESRSGYSVLVQAVIEMAHTLRLDVVAEGVENWQQQSALKGLGCPHSQGYLFSRALPVSLFTAFAESWPRRALRSSTSRRAWRRSDDGRARFISGTDLGCRVVTRAHPGGRPRRCRL